jgi:hypothetical protein
MNSTAPASRPAPANDLAEHSSAARRALPAVLAITVVAVTVVVGVLGVLSLAHWLEPPRFLPGIDQADPGIANLDPDLRAALLDAATDAAGDGVTVRVNSGWRSPEDQERLLRDAVIEYGSEQEAARWVATVETSAHVSGDAVDIGELDATLWMEEHGAVHGLCQIYDNEPWHFELVPEAADAGCPDLYHDPTEDPRMQR